MTIYTDLSERDRGELLAATAEYLKVFTTIFGPERGTELFDTLGPALGQDLRGELMFSMLTGNVPGKVTLRKVDSAQAVPLIKVIRQFTGCGLKEAKDCYDRVRNGGVVTFKIPFDQRSAFVSSLIGVGGEAI